MSMVVEVGLKLTTKSRHRNVQGVYCRVQARLNNDVQPPTSTPDKAGSYLPTFSPHRSAPGPRTCPALLTPLTEILGDFDH